MAVPGHTGHLIAGLLALLLLLPGAFAQEQMDWVYTAEELTIQVDISSGMSPSGTANYVEASLNLFPRDDWRQDGRCLHSDRP